MTGFSLKDQLFNREKVDYLGGLLAANNESFSKRKFVSQVMKQLPSLELKQRIVLIAGTLEEHLPKSFPAAANHILESLPAPLDPTLRDNDFGDFIFAPFGEFIARNGLSLEQLDLSLRTLKELTKRFSMEDAMRAFLRHFPDQTLAELSRWAEDTNYHVRRLVSESTRPLLPWSGRVNLKPERTLPLLDKLHADPTRYVTRSVANHLNDLAKSDPALVVRTLERWHGQSRQNAAELKWMTRHALRTLIKRGDARSLRLLGVDPAPKLSIGNLCIINQRLAPGDFLEFSLEITSQRDQLLVVDYAIDFMKAGGKRSIKVFKAAKLSLKKSEARTVAKKHRLHKAATTYKLYPGEHKLTIQINGQPFTSASFYIV